MFNEKFMLLIYLHEKHQIILHTVMNSVFSNVFTQRFNRQNSQDNKQKDQSKFQYLINYFKTLQRKKPYLWFISVQNDHYDFANNQGLYYALLTYWDWYPSVILGLKIHWWLCNSIKSASKFPVLRKTRRQHSVDLSPPKSDCTYILYQNMAEWFISVSK